MTRLIIFASMIAMFASIAPAHPVPDEPVILDEPRAPDRPLKPKRDVWV